MNVGRGIVKMLKEFYEYRYWILFTFVMCVGFLGGIVVGLEHVNSIH